MIDHSLSYNLWMVILKFLSFFVQIGNLVIWYQQIKAFEQNFDGFICNSYLPSLHFQDHRAFFNVCKWFCLSEDNRDGLFKSSNLVITRLETYLQYLNSSFIVIILQCWIKPSKIGKSLHSPHNCGKHQQWIVI